MLRSPFFYILIFLTLISCKKRATILVKSDNFKSEAKLMQERGLNELQKSNYDSAFYYFNKSKVIFESSKDSSNTAFNLIQMASIQQVNGDYYGTKETLTEALPFIKNDNNYMVAVNNIFGIADKELSIYDDAVSYYNQAVKEAKDEASKQSPLNNIAVIYIKQQKYDTAITILESILKTKSIDEFVKSKSRVIDNLGFAYFKKGLNAKGFQLLNEGLKLRIESDDSYGSIGSYLHLAEFFSTTDIKKSNEYAKKAYEIATKLDSVDERLKALSFLISNDAGRSYGEQYIFINDSIIKIRNNFKNKFAKIKYDSKKEKDENQKLRLEKVENQVALQKSEIEKISFLSGFIILGLVLFFVNKNHKNKAQIIKLETAYDTETRIAKHIHDELANDVFYAITFAQTQSLTKEEVKETLLRKLNHIYTRVRGISRENNSIDTGINYSIHLKEMLSTYNSNDTNVIINSIEKVNWESIDEIKKVTIHRVLQELMVNMKKHSDAPVVVLKFENTANTIVINYTDNGKGCEKDQIIKNGLQNMENRILSIKGTITFDSEPEKGFKVKITLPK